MRYNLKPCPFCGSEVKCISYWQSFEHDSMEYLLELCCPRCGEFKLTHNTYFDGFRPKTAFEIWNTRVQEVYKYEIHGEDDVDDWSED